MSHKLKASKAISPRQRREEAQVRYMAGLIKDQAALDQLLSGANAEIRAAMIERLLPRLSFVPAELVS
jgi:hypothetical protein